MRLHSYNKIEMQIIHEEEKFLVVEKVAGQLILPIPKSNERTLRDEILEKYPEIAEFDKERGGLVHRLDRDTSGLLLVARAKGALRFFQGEFGARRIKKEYLALVIGEVKKDREIIDLPLGRSAGGKIVPHPVWKKEREAITEYEVIKRFNDFTLLRVLPKTGRMHQIRAHLAAVGHPVVGDKIYNGKKAQKQGSKETQRLFLHASKLEFFDPDAKARKFESPLPPELQQVLEKMRSQK